MQTVFDVVDNSQQDGHACDDGSQHGATRPFRVIRKRRAAPRPLGQQPSPRRPYFANARAGSILRTPCQPPATGRRPRRVRHTARSSPQAAPGCVERRPSPLCRKQARPKAQLCCLALTGTHSSSGYGNITSDATQSQFAGQTLPSIRSSTLSATRLPGQVHPERPRDGGE